MRNPKFDFQDTRKPSYIFESAERIMYIVSAIVGASSIAYKIGEVFGWIVS